MSFLSQLQLCGLPGSVFSYCLPPRPTTGSFRWLEIGHGPVGVLTEGPAWVPLVHNWRHLSLYYVGLLGLKVGHMQVPIPKSIYRLTKKGDGGVVLDSGTKVTSLPKFAYKVFRSSFIAQAGNLTWASKRYLLDTCYNISYGADSINVPNVSFHFSIKPIQTRLGGCKHFCHAFAPSNTTFSIIGNTQLAGIQISIDTIAGHVCLRPFSIIPIHEHNNMMMAVVVSRSTIHTVNSSSCGFNETFRAVDPIYKGCTPLSPL